MALSGVRAEHLRVIDFEQPKNNEFLAMSLDKPMHGHNLMQAIAPVNRVFKDKPGRLVMD